MLSTFLVHINCLSKHKEHLERTFRKELYQIKSYAIPEYNINRLFDNRVCIMRTKNSLKKLSLKLSSLLFYWVCLDQIPTHYQGISPVILWSFHGWIVSDVMLKFWDTGPQEVTLNDVEGGDIYKLKPCFVQLLISGNLLPGCFWSDWRTVRCLRYALVSCQSEYKHLRLMLA